MLTVYTIIEGHSFSQSKEITKWLLRNNTSHRHTSSVRRTSVPAPSRLADCPRESAYSPYRALLHSSTAQCFLSAGAAQRGLPRPCRIRSVPACLTWLLGRVSKAQDDSEYHKLKHFHSEVTVRRIFRIFPAFTAENCSKLCVLVSSKVFAAFGTRRFWLLCLSIPTLYTISRSFARGKCPPHKNPVSGDYRRLEQGFRIISRHLPPSR